MHEYGYTVTEHDADRPWIVRAQRHETVQLDDDVSFFQWAADRYLRERFTVELDPWEPAGRRMKTGAREPTPSLAVAGAGE